MASGPVQLNRQICHLPHMGGIVAGHVLHERQQLLHGRGFAWLLAAAAGTGAMGMLMGMLMNMLVIVGMFVFHCHFAYLISFISHFIIGGIIRLVKAIIFSGISPVPGCVNVQKMV